MTPAEHLKKHKELHRALDELLTDFIQHTEKLPSKTTLMEFLQWSGNQIQEEGPNH